MELGALSVGGAYKTQSWEAAAKLGMQWYLSYIQKIPNVKVRVKCNSYQRRLAPVLHFSSCEMTLCHSKSR